MLIGILRFIKEDTLILNFLNITKRLLMAITSLFKQKQVLEIESELKDLAKYLTNIKLLKSQGALNSIENLNLKFIRHHNPKYIDAPYHIMKLLDLLCSLKKVDIVHRACSNVTAEDLAKILLQGYQNIRVITV